MAHPRIDVMSGKYLIFVTVDHVGVVEKQQREGASRRTGIDRLPKPVENKDWFVQGGTHKARTIAISPATSNDFGVTIFVRNTKIYGIVKQLLTKNTTLMVSSLSHPVNNQRVH
jgi:hypothetical protein